MSLTVGRVHVFWLSVRADELMRELQVSLGFINKYDLDFNVFFQIQLTQMRVTNTRHKDDSGSSGFKQNILCQNYK
jgi:hypothetical protein